MLPLFYVISHYSNLPFRAWEQRELGELMNVKSVKRIHQSDWTDKGIRFLRARDIVSASKGKAPSEYLYISRKIYEEYSKISGKVENGDLLVTGVGSIGIPMLINHDEPLYFKDGNIIWFQNMKYINGEFFYYSFISYSIQKFIRDSAGTGTVGTYTIDSGRKTPIYLSNNNEQEKIGSFFKLLDNTIALHQRKLDTLKLMKKGLLQQMFPKSEEDVPRIRFADFDEEWNQRKLGEEFEKINERNDGSFGKTHWISVAKMYFVEPNKVLSNNIDTRTYVMRKGDIAFEGHSNTDFKFGRFVANDIGPGIVSELFPVYRHKTNYDNNYWKNAIQLEHIMAPIYSKSITSSGNSSNKLDSKHFLNQKIYIADFEEQEKIGSIFKQLDNTIILYQNKLNKFDILKKAYLQTMFI
ncbi:restriction endonuclease subunit S [Listeria sp. FSL L7-1425]|uniref:restriction endonuclease subunit S n=1 Tax=Listeria cossartiae TaxID=2838249 RepID=UPI001624A28A|nr:restriction endonuclease subunit S [Listeria cossartiae]MBC1567972.1 restriction endonuclease subunit S [Listeria cossartiae subsp. cossartiae]